MLGLTSGLNANVTKTALDKVFMQRYSPTPAPQLARANDDRTFQQDSADKAAVIMEVLKGVGVWEETPEQAEYKGDVPMVNDQITFQVAKLTKKFHITEEIVEDDQHGVVRKAIEQMGDKARVTQNKESMAIYRNAGSTTLTSDGVALISASHSNIAGDTVSNLLSNAFSVDGVEEGITSLLEQKDQAGDIVGHEARTVLVPPALYKEAVEITESTLEANTTDNNKNVYSAKYNLFIKQSQYLGAAAGGSATNYFMLGEYHSVMRWVRVPVQTRLIPSEFEPNGDAVYRGRYREVYGAVTYEGIVGKV